MEHAFKRIIFYARTHRASEGVIDSLHKINAFFVRHKIATFLDKDTASFFPDLNIPVLTRDKMDPKSDLIVVVGGDGSLLSAARMAITVSLPVIGVNRGRLGFLTDICPQEIESQFSDVLNGAFVEDHRFLLQAEIKDEHNTYYQGDALNDVVLMPGDEPHLIQFDLFINNEFVCEHNADGLIISTPTGSTAYSLSAGGPIISPELNVISISPMFPHSLNSRSIVVDSHSEITLRIKTKTEHSPRISCDGHERQLIKPGQQTIIRKNPTKLKLLHPKSYNYYQTLREKLGWET
jgi:NAD+ kinase